MCYRGCAQLKVLEKAAEGVASVPALNVRVFG